MRIYVTVMSPYPRDSEITILISQVWAMS